MGKGQSKAIELMMSKNLYDKGLTSWWQYSDMIYETLDMFQFSERWNWTPEQIRKISDQDRKVYRLLLAGINKADMERNK